MAYVASMVLPLESAYPGAVALKNGSQMSNTSSAWELVRNADALPLTRSLVGGGTLGMEHSSPCFN